MCFVRHLTTTNLEPSSTVSNYPHPSALRWMPPLSASQTVPAHAWRPIACYQHRRTVPQGAALPDESGRRLRSASDLAAVCLQHSIRYALGSERNCTLDLDI